MTQSLRSNRRRFQRFAATLVVVSLTAITIVGQGHKTTKRFPASARLDGPLLLEAVREGEQSRPEPYWLYPNSGSRKATAAVYTPFIRVAIAAYLAKERGEHVVVDLLPKWIVEPVVHVVMRPADDAVLAAGEQFANDPPLGKTPFTQIGLLWRDRAPFINFVAPNWMTTDLSYLNAIGGQPFPDAVAAAAFEPDLMLQNVDVCGWWRKGNHFFPSRGVMDQDSMRNWR